MDFAWTREQIALRSRVAAIVASGPACDAGARDEAATFDRDAWRALASGGVQGLAVPTEFGGRGQDLLTTVCVLEGLGEACEDNGLLFALGAHMWACQAPIVHFGTVDQRARFLPGLANGERIGAHAATEPDAGSDLSRIRTVARRRGDRYELTGTKTFVTNASVADVLIVFAKLEPVAGEAGGLTAFLIEQGTPGCTIARTVPKMGLRTAQMGEVVLDRCEVPAANRLGDEGAGMTIFSTGMEWERGLILAPSLGTMSRLLERSIRHARTRTQFDEAIGKFQLVSAKIAAMKLRLETARALVYRFAWLKDRGRSAFLEASLAKLHVSESWVETCLDAMQIRGGAGYLTETGLERELRDALGSRIYSGTSEIQRVIVAEMLGV
jgi:hypothetical protein